LNSTAVAQTDPNASVTDPAPAGLNALDRVGNGGRP
jgi:hypothetical protein